MSIFTFQLISDILCRGTIVCLFVFFLLVIVCLLQPFMASESGLLITTLYLQSFLVFNKTEVAFSLIYLGLMDYCITLDNQYFSYIHDENNDPCKDKWCAGVYVWTDVLPVARRRKRGGVVAMARETILPHKAPSTTTIDRRWESPKTWHSFMCRPGTTYVFDIQRNKRTLLWRLCNTAEKLCPITLKIIKLSPCRFHKLHH